MENFKEILLKKLNIIKCTYANLKNCKGYFEQMPNDDCSFFIKPITKNEYEILGLDDMLSLFDTQKTTDLKGYSYFKTTCQYANNQIIFEYRNIPFGAINIKNENMKDI